MIDFQTLEEWRSKDIIVAHIMRHGQRLIETTPSSKNYSRSQIRKRPLPVVLPRPLKQTPVLHLFAAVRGHGKPGGNVELSPSEHRCEQKSCFNRGIVVFDFTIDASIE